MAVCPWKWKLLHVGEESGNTLLKKTVRRCRSAQLLCTPCETSTKPVDLENTQVLRTRSRHHSLEWARGCQTSIVLRGEVLSGVDAPCT